MNNNSKSKVLIAGGAGFIGSHLVERLSASGARVVCVDNLQTGAMVNIKHVNDGDNVEFVKHDIKEPLSIDEPLDQIWNLASPASPPKYQKDPIDTLLTNVIGTKNLLDLAVEHGARFLQASTSEVYGNPLEHPQKETYFGNVDPTGPRSCYDEGKRAAETLCFDYGRSKGADIRVIRIFNTYGPRMAPDDGRVVSNFIVQALRGEPITIYGDGSQTRSFQYIDDLIEGMVLVMKHEGGAKKSLPADLSDKALAPTEILAKTDLPAAALAKVGPFNLGNPVEFTVKELAQKVIELTGSKSELVYRELPKDDPIKRKPDISKAKETLGWEPKVPLEEGLKKTIDYFRGL